MTRPSVAHLAGRTWRWHSLGEGSRPADVVAAAAPVAAAAGDDIAAAVAAGSEQALAHRRERGSVEAEPLLAAEDWDQGVAGAVVAVEAAAAALAQGAALRPSAQAAPRRCR